MTPTENAPSAPVVLVPGHWLGAWAWDEVAADLRSRRHAVTAVTLPGANPADPNRTVRTPADQAAALEQTVLEMSSTHGRPVVLVGHSGANHPVSSVVARRPDLIVRVVWVDSGPVADGTTFDTSSADESGRPLPAFEVLGRVASLEGLDQVALDRFRERAVPVPGPVLLHRTRVPGSAWRDVPTTIIACSMPSAVMLQLADEGHPMMTPVAELTDRETVDLPTGHWPMWSRPKDLAAAISAAAS